MSTHPFHRILPAWPFATEGSGTDIYAARIDADGNVVAPPGS